MSVIVHKSEPIENALKRLHREAIRENFFEVLMEKRYRQKPTTARCEKRRAHKKTKRRRRRANRRIRAKRGY